MRAILILQLAFVSMLSAQQNFEWVKGFGSVSGGGFGDGGVSVVTDKDDNVIVAGNYAGSGSFGQNGISSVSSSYDMFVCKMNSSGAIIWVKSFGGSGFDNASGITTDPNGNIYFTGGYVGNATFGSTTVTGGSGGAGCLVKLDNSGDVQWVKTLTSSGSFLSSVAVSGSAVYVTGNFTGSGNFAGNPVTSSGSIDGFVARVDFSGNVAWVKSFGGQVIDQGDAIAPGPAGSAYIGGIFSSPATFGTITKSANGLANGFICAIDMNGDFQWVTPVGNNDHNVVLAVASDNAGNVYATGRYSGTATFGNNQLTAFGSSDVFVSKLDGSGNFAWATRFDESSATAFYTANNPSSIAVDHAGNVYTTGDFQGTHTFGSTTNPAAQITSFQSTGPSQSFDAFISKLDNSGNFSAVWRLGGTLDENAVALWINGNSEIFVTGNYKSVPFQAGDLTLENNGEAFALKLAADPSIGFAENTLGSLARIYPVPAKDKIIIESGSRKTGSWATLYDATGIKLKNEKIQSRLLELDVSDLEPGIYLLQISGSNDKICRR